jgi:hypothetical protein
MGSPLISFQEIDCDPVNADFRNPFVSTYAISIGIPKYAATKGIRHT